MPFTFKVRDTGGNIILDEQSLVTKVLTTASIPFGDYAWRTFTHPDLAVYRYFLNYRCEFMTSWNFGGEMGFAAGWVQYSLSGTTLSYRLQCPHAKEWVTNWEIPVTVVIGIF